MTQMETDNACPAEDVRRQKLYRRIHMERREMTLSEGWKFWFGEKESGKEKEVVLPHDWVLEAPYSKEKKDASQGFHVQRGTGRYEKELELQVQEDHRYFLDFGGVYEKSRVYVNGFFAGGHPYGYTPFRLEITDFVKTGTNVVEVSVESDDMPADRWYTGAGIYRTVKLLETGKWYLDETEMAVTVEFPGQDYQEAVVIVKTGCGRRVKGCLRKGDFHVESEGEDGTLSFHISYPKLWSAETPELYQLQVALTDREETYDTVSCRIGLRDVEMISGKGMAVNGKTVKLRGVCLHQDVGCQGSAAKKEIWRKRLESLKEMGCNAIRAAHHVHSAEFMDLCDEMGFYVYEECFDKWTGGHYGQFFETEWKTDLDAMVKKDRNRPSVIIWGVGNEVENQGQPSMLKILKMLVRRVKELDSTRPVTYAMNPHFKRESKVDMSMITDIQQFVDEADDTEIWDVPEKIARIQKIGELVDILSCNYQEQWYEQIHQAMPDKLILGTEIYQYFKGHPEQFKNYTEDIPALVPERYEYVIGGMIWAGIAYLGESMGYPAKGWNGALIRTNGERKAGYYIMQSYWTRNPMVHFSVMDYSLEDEGVKDHWDIPPYENHWHFPQFSNAVIPYMVATNCEEVEIYVNGSRIYTESPKQYPNGLIKGFLSWLAGQVLVIGKNGGKEVCRQITKTPGPAVKLGFDRPVGWQESEMAEQQEDLTEILPAESGYQALYTVRALDEEGTRCFRCSSRVRFRAEGPAEILGTDNGDAKSHESFAEPFMHMYHGAVSVQIRLTGEPGMVRLFADAEGMRSGELAIMVQ